jgi:polyhydroxybutyrate depolymerase
MRLLLASLAGVLVLAGTAVAVLEPGSNQRSLAFDEATYAYLVYRPDGHDGATPAPLIVDLHGWTSNGPQQSVLSGLRAIADREDFVVTHPSAPGAAWDGGICCLETERDDVGFVRALVAAIAREIPIDPARVYVTGLSNGGAMTHRLACEAPDVFAAAAPLAFPLSVVPFSECQPSRPIPLLMTMGLTDVLVPYDGGSFPGAIESFEHWRTLNGCHAGVPDDVVTAESGLSWCETYAGCDDGVDTGLCSVTAASFGGAFFDGHILYANPDFDLAEVVWTFLERWTMPADRTPELVTMAGAGIRKAPRSPKEKASLGWTLAVASDGWSAASDGGAGVTGTWTAEGRKSRRLALSAPAPALSVFLGEEVAPGGDPTLTLAVNKRRTRAKLRGKVPLADGSTYRVALKGPIAP